MFASNVDYSEIVLTNILQTHLGFLDYHVDVIIKVVEGHFSYYAITKTMSYR